MKNKIHKIARGLAITCILWLGLDMLDFYSRQNGEYTQKVCWFDDPFINLMVSKNNPTNYWSTNGVGEPILIYETTIGKCTWWTIKK